MEISQYVVASSTACTKCLCAAIKSKKSADGDDADDEEDDEEDEDEEEDTASRSIRWPEHSFDLRALPKAVQVCCHCPCGCTRTRLQDLTIERTKACLRNHKHISLRLFLMRYTASCGCLGGARE